MTTPNLSLNVEGATANGTAISKSGSIIETDAATLLKEYGKLAGAVQGIAMDSATEFSQQQNAAVLSVRETVNKVNMAVSEAKSDTVGYDRSGGAASKVTGQG
ncbi:Uncharacterised protein (plasmid) [Tsukamurella tyrosinosolvens]|uniref:Uncharacterized protein n=1 Tax=Tsukamurella tyrosinosolvens TaxID=57704 RepID=A0A1H4UBU4_TSUTY|nr:hypothetical protein [Tsukamurella tyrosinosolvens]KXO92972.1 hypothetical protein AXK58_13965 [Tsukamurella tyrosinosolvens]SEC66100.1 hypothetical protein SAMN04489793_2844 [Tsukamurella tyrosinosolvens]VEH94113.1 Uncharacterised protein [Tsukamurella tyrosinosolvens]